MEQKIEGLEQYAARNKKILGQLYTQALPKDCGFHNLAHPAARTKYN